MNPMSQMEGFPILESYSYLGVVIDDALNLRLEVKQKKKLQAQLNRATWILSSNDLDLEAKLHIW